jgi:hypothetical protein
MFLITWSEQAFEQMQRLFDDHPGRHTDFTYALRQLARELHQAADDWGESRAGTERFGTAGPLSVWIDVDPDDRTVEVITVGLSRRAK